MILLALVCLLLVTLSAIGGDYRKLRLTSSLMMLGVPVLGAGFFEWHGLETNVGNIFYAATLFGTVAAYFEHGSKFAIGIRNITLWIIAGYFVVIQTILLIDILPPDISAATSLLFGYAIRVVAASFVAYYIVQSSLVFMLEKMRNLHFLEAAFIATLLAQALDTAIFFPIAFYGQLSTADIVQAAIAGFIIKAVIAVLSLPFLAVLDYSRRHHILWQK